MKLKLNTTLVFMLFIILLASIVHANTNVGGAIEEDTRWTMSNSPYIVTGNITLNEGVTLTIEPGVEIHFERYRRMTLNGAMEVTGTEESPVIFQGTSASAGHWEGIFIQNAGSAVLEHFELRHGGHATYNSDRRAMNKSGTGNLEMRYGLFSNNHGQAIRVEENTGTITMEQVTVQNSNFDGMQVTSANTGPITLTDCIFTENGYSGLASASKQVTAENCTFSHNGTYGIHMTNAYLPDLHLNTVTENATAGIASNGGTLTGDIVIPFHFESWRIINNISLAEEASLTIGHGVVIDFEMYRKMTINGAMEAIGTEDSPVIFRGTSASAGHWAGIYIQNAGSAVLEHFELRHGGHATYNSDRRAMNKSGTGNLEMRHGLFSNNHGQAIRVEGNTGTITMEQVTVQNSNFDGMNVTSANTGPITLTDCVFTENGSSGLAISSGQVTATDCTFSNNGNYGVYQTGGYLLNLPENTFTDNATGAVAYHSITLSEQMRWTSAGNPYHIVSDFTIAETGTLSIEEGVEVEFYQYRTLTVNGTLNITGTEDNPVTFEGRTKNSNFWQGIIIQNAGNAALEHMHMKHAGYNLYSPRRSIHKTGSGTLQMTHCTISEGNGDGFRVWDNTGEVTLVNSVFTNHSSSGLNTNSGQVNATGCTFSHNGIYGIHMNNTYLPDLHLNTVIENTTAAIASNGGTLTGDIVIPFHFESWRIINNISLAEEASLTIGHGVVVDFAMYRRMTLNGAMEAIGTEDSPVIFRGTSASAGHWAGIYIQNAGSAVLEHFELRHGGQATYNSDRRAMNKSGTGNLEMRHGLFSHNHGQAIRVEGNTGTITMEQVTVQNSNFDGMHVTSANTGPITLTDCVFTENGYSGLASASEQVTAANCTFSNNGRYGIHMTNAYLPDLHLNTVVENATANIASNGGTLKGNILIPFHFESWRIINNISLAEEASLTIGPGVVVDFAMYRRITINGTMEAIGTEESPVIFQGTSASAGHWAGIYIQNAGSAVLEHFELRHGGQATYNWDRRAMNKSGTGNLEMRHGLFSHNHGQAIRVEGNTGTITMEQVTVQNSNFDGMRVTSANTGPITLQDSVFTQNGQSGIAVYSPHVTISGCTFTHNNNYGIYMRSLYLHNLQSNTIVNNGLAAIGADGGTLTGTILFPEAFGTIRVMGTLTVAEGAELILEPGMEVQFAAYAGITVNGSLEAMGTQGQPIIFRGTSENPGHWRGIYIQNNGNAILESIELMHAGHSTYASDRRAIHKSGSGNLTMSHCIVSENNGHALRLDGSTGSHTIERSQFISSGIGIYARNIHQHLVLAGCQFVGNSSFGVQNVNSREIDARQCWWGHASGPFHTTKNPEGEGDRVSDGVIFEPWSNSPNYVEILSPVRSGTLVQGDQLRFHGTLPYNPWIGYQWIFSDGRIFEEQTPGMVTFPVVETVDIAFHAVVDEELYAFPDQRQFIIVEDTGDFPDLEVTAAAAPDLIEAGDFVTVHYSVQNTGLSEITGRTWEDALYLSYDPWLDTQDILLASETREEEIPAGESYEGTLEFFAPAVRQGDLYLILSIDDQWQIIEQHRMNNEYPVSTQIILPELFASQPHVQLYPRGMMEQYYVLNAPGAENIRINFGNLPAGVQIYVRFGDLPTLSEYDFLVRDGYLIIPAAAAGKWYILIYGEVTEPGEFTVEYELVPVAITSATPAHHTTSLPLELQIQGIGFMDPLDIILHRGGSAYPAQEVDIHSLTMASAFFDADTLPAGTYSIQVVRDEESDLLADALIIVQDGEAILETRLILPARMGYHILATTYVEYENTGNIAMPTPLLYVTVTQNGRQGGILTLDKSRLTQGFWTSAMPAGFSDAVTFMASGEMPGLLQPGESGRVPVYYAGFQRPWDFSYPPFEWEVRVLDADTDIPIDWDDLQDEYLPAHVSFDAWDIVWENFRQDTGDTWGDYIAMLSRKALYLYQQEIPERDIDPLLSLAIAEADGLHPQPVMTWEVDALMEIAELVHPFTRKWEISIISRFEEGPFGMGWQHNWQEELHQSEDGTIMISGNTPSIRIFQPDIRYAGRYLSQPGDRGVLKALGAGRYELLEADGIRKVFRSDWKLDFIEDPNGNRITCTYSQDRLTRLTYSDDLFVEFEYNAAGYISRITDAQGRQLHYTYEGKYLSSVQDDLGRTVTYTYETDSGSPALHAITKITYPDGTEDTFAYNARGHLDTQTIKRSDNIFQYGYSRTGRVDITNALDNTQTMYFNPYRQLIKARSPLGEIVQVHYNENGEISAMIDPEGYRTLFRYDRRGNLIEVSNALQQKTTMRYNSPWNRLTSITSPAGYTTSYQYDVQGNAAAIHYANGSQESFSYDSSGLMTGWTNRSGNTIQYQYDGQGRLTGKVMPDETEVLYAYDAMGNLLQAGDMSFTYNGQGLLERINYPGERFLEFTYDAIGRRLSSQDQLGDVLLYSYQDGKLQKISDSNGDIAVYSYDILGRLERVTMGNGMYTQYGYDAAGRQVSQVNYNSDDQIVSTFEYSYNRRGHRVGMQTHYGTWTYRYDEIGQLIQATLDSSDPSVPAQDIVYAYDPEGNRISTVINGETAAYQSNVLNQYLQIGEYTYQYDANGNLIEEDGPDGKTVYVYDDENRLIGVFRGADEWLYAYDALGNRVSKSKNGVLSHYIIDPVAHGDLVASYNSAGQLQSRYRYGLELASQVSQGEQSFYFFDPMGNTSELVDTAGNILNQYAYTPFGRTIKEVTQQPNPFQFMGMFGARLDGHGTYHVRARQYSQFSGSFMGHEPLGANSGSVNYYQYAGNNPLHFLDPDGLFFRRAWNAVRDYAVTAAVAVCTVAVVVVAVKTAPIWVPAALIGGKAVGAAAMACGKMVAGGVAAGGKAALATGMKYGIPAAVYSGPYLAAYGDKALSFTCALFDIETGTLPDGAAMAGMITRRAITDLVEMGKWYAGVRPDASVYRQTRRSNTGTVGSYDPNQKLAVSGYGTDNYVRAQTLLAYRVDFENFEEATAPAQRVQVFDPLSSLLDWSTFEILEAGFGDITVSIPQGLKHFSTTVPYSYADDEYTFDVNIDIDIYIQGGTVYANFFTIDPETGFPPSDPGIGFLMPEDETGRGQGYFTYALLPKADLASGTQIRNIATIQFDGSVLIDTNQVDPMDPGQGTDPDKEALVTIDAGRPFSSVDALPAETITRVFTVSWSGEDDIGGSGIAFYDIYVRQQPADSSSGMAREASSWQIWLENTQETSAQFEGEDGSIYSFYSMATDNVGYRETKTAQAEASTTVNIQQGSLKVTILPEQAALDGAQWLIIELPELGWQDSGHTLEELAVGEYTVHFKTMPRYTGWHAPADQPVTVEKDELTEITGEYEKRTAAENWHLLE